MPAFSVIVPVYNVEPYIRQCLDSVVEQTFTDFELLVIDDASTDGSTRIIAEYRSDPRLSVITLARNGGLGNARNVGLDHARGEYVLFVDSDDWLERDALAAMHARVQRTDPDVVVFDYARTYWQGHVRRNAVSHVLQPGDEEVFPLERRPQLLELLMVAWNKLYRRQFLEDLGLRFRQGFYEDLPWTYPVMMAARRITVLDQVCYYYRQRRHGNILRTSSTRHFDVFDQYEAVFAFVDARPELDRWRPALYQRMLRHYVTILAKGGVRVPPREQRAFFHRTAQHYARFRPAAMPALEGPEARLHRALERNSYPLFAALTGVADLQTRSRRRLQKLHREARGFASRRVRAARLRAYQRFLRQPIDGRLAVFAAYWYRGYACNPRAIYEKLLELSDDFKAVWVVRGASEDRMPPGVPYVVEGTREYYRVMARAKYFVNNVNFPNFLVKRPGQVHLQTQHGTPLKTMGLGLQRYPVAAAGMNFAKMLRRSDRWDYNLSSNRHSTEVWGREFPCEYEALEYGYPRNDIFFRYTAEDEQRIRAELGIPADKTVVLYAPTFRDYEHGFQLQVDLARLWQTLGDRFVVLARAHYYYEVLPQLQALQEQGAVVDVSEHPDVERLCLAADILLTDYSSIMFDYANLGRPIVVYAPDWDVYRQVRGVYFDLMTQPPGAVARTEDELMEVFRSKSYASDTAMQQLEQFRARFCEFDDGHAAERVVRRVFFDEPVAPPSSAAHGTRAGAGSAPDG